MRNKPLLAIGAAAIAASAISDPVLAREAEIGRYWRPGGRYGKTVKRSNRKGRGRFAYSFVLPKYRGRNAQPDGNARAKRRNYLAKKSRAINRRGK